MSGGGRVIVVGAGLAGLACALRLQRDGVEPLILERADAAGGRVRTDGQDGFLLDRGFQVYLSAYPEAGSVTLEDGETLQADAVVVATDAETASRLVPGLRESEPAWRSVTGIEFAAPRSPLAEPIIALNGNPGGLVNNVCVLSDVSPRYAPEGKALLSVSVLGSPGAGSLEDGVRAELRTWFGEDVDDWEHLRTIRIRKALPEQPPAGASADHAGFEVRDGIYVGGDHCRSASIEGAVVSGTRAAEAILG